MYINICACVNINFYATATTIPNFIVVVVIFYGTNNGTAWKNKYFERFLASCTGVSVHAIPEILRPQVLLFFFWVFLACWASVEYSGVLHFVLWWHGYFTVSCPSFLIQKLIYQQRTVRIKKILPIFFFSSNISSFMVSMLISRTNKQFSFTNVRAQPLFYIKRWSKRIDLTKQSSYFLCNIINVK